MPDEAIEVGEVFQLKSLYFPADSANIGVRGEIVLLELYLFLEAHPTVTIEIGGHTNALPPHRYCDALSKRRAQNSRAYLVQRGIDPKRIAYKGYGKRRPIASNHTEAGRKKNQRIEVKILKR